MKKIGRLTIYYNYGGCFEEELISFEFLGFGISVDRKTKYFDIRFLVFGCNLIFEFNYKKNVDKQNNV